MRWNPFFEEAALCYKLDTVFSILPVIEPCRNSAEVAANLDKNKNLNLFYIVT